MTDLTFTDSRPAARRPTGNRALRTITVRVAARLLTTITALGTALGPLVRRAAGRLRDDRGQATTEYALVLLAAALVALLAVGWATAGGGAQRINQLFDRVVDSVIDRV